MTDIKLLELLSDYYGAQRNVNEYLMLAIQDFEMGLERHSWDGLFRYCAAKDDREELWKRIQSEYPFALYCEEVWI